MPWEHIRPEYRGICLAQRCPDGSCVEVLCESGRIETGRSRMRWGSYVSVTFPGEPPLVAKVKDAHACDVMALRVVNRLLSARGWTLLVRGNMPGFHQTGLSFGFGAGYVPGLRRAVRPLEAVTVEEWRAGKPGAKAAGDGEACPAGSESGLGDAVEARSRGG